MPTKKPRFCVRLGEVLGSPKAGVPLSFVTFFDRLVPLCVAFIDPIFCPSRSVCSRSVSSHPVSRRADFSRAVYLCAISNRNGSLAM